MTCNMVEVVAGLAVMALGGQIAHNANAENQPGAALFIDATLVAGGGVMTLGGILGIAFVELGFEPVPSH